MKLYSTGLMGFVAIVTSILAYVERKEGFDIEYPSLFWGGQLLLFLIFMTTLLYSFFHWDRSTHVKKYRLVLSVITCICMYAIAYTGSKYSLLFILAIGIIEVFFTRKRFGLVHTIL
ncbi:MAG: hypothetical protein ACLT3H_13995 [Roseburia sp.]